MMSDQGISKEEQGVITTLAGSVTHLRDIKQMEMKWLDRYSVLIVPAIAAIIYWTAANPTNSSARPSRLILITVGAFIYMGLTMGIQWILCNERNSYYRVFRTVIRAQYHLGLFRNNFMADWMANAAYPKGFGPITDEDGTQPEKTFSYRNFYTFGLYCAYLVVAAIAFFLEPRVDLRWRLVAAIVAALLAVTDLLFLKLKIYPLDRERLRQGVLDEKGLLGTDPAWYPNGTGSGKT